MKKRMIVVAMMAVSCVLFTHSSSEACTPNASTPVGESFESVLTNQDETLPSNVQLISATIYDRSLEERVWELQDASQQVTLVSFELGESIVYGEGDVQGNALFWKPPSDLEVGSQIRDAECHHCPWRSITRADLSAPPQPILSSAKYQAYFDNDGCRFGNLGTLKFDVAPRTDAPELHLLAFIYVGRDEGKAQTSTQPLALEMLHHERQHLSLTLNEKTNRIASPNKSFCLAVEFVDGAGNRSPRSESLCVGVLNSQPTLEPSKSASEDEQTEPSCSAASQHQPGTIRWWVFLPLFGLLHRRRQRQPNL